MAARDLRAAFDVTSEFAVGGFLLVEPGSLDLVDAGPRLLDALADVTRSRASFRRPRSRSFRSRPPAQ
jgi:hypothetical protein